MDVFSSGAAMLKAGHYMDLLRQVTELKRQVHLVEAERKACDDEANETVKRNQQLLTQLKQDVSDMKTELSELVRRSQRQPELGILQILRDNNIDVAKYKLSKTADVVLEDLDARIAEMVKQTDLFRHQTQTINCRIREMDEQMYFEELQHDQPFGSGPASSKQSPSSPPAAKTVDNPDVTLTEIQSVRQKITEALHVQRQYGIILDVVSAERIGHEAQLLELEKSINEAKAEADKLKEVREAARRSRDAAKMELQQHEETLVTSTRETDRLLSDYKRRIDDMKSSTTTTTRQPNKPPQTTKRTSLVPRQQLSVTPADGEDGPSERATLHETKKAIDHLKSVTGATDIRSTIHIVESQREKCDELRQQYAVLQDREGYLLSTRDSLTIRLNQLIDAATTPRQQGPADAQLFPEDQTTVSFSDQLDETVTAEGFEEQMLLENDNQLIVDLMALIVKICNQIPFGPAVDETHFTGQCASMENGLRLLDVLETKLSSLMELLKSLNQKANVDNPADYLYSQQAGGQLSMPSSPRPIEVEQVMPSQPVAESTSATERAAAAVRTVGATNKMRTVDSFSDEDVVPTRGFLKRQTRIIVESKTKKQSNQHQRPRKGGD